MPIKAEMRWFYPIDWPQLSNHIRFERAGGVCQRCGRPRVDEEEPWRSKQHHHSVYRTHTFTQRRRAKGSAVAHNAAITQNPAGPAAP